MSYPKRGISVDIGNDNIKIVEYAKSKDKIKAKGAIILKTPEGGINDGQIMDIEKMAECIGNALKSAKVKSKNIIFTLSSSKVITREVDLPDLAVKKLDTLIKLNAEEYFPVNLAEYTLDYSIVEKISGPEGDQVKVNIIAALTTVVETYVELADALKLRIAGIDYSGNSIVGFSKCINEDKTYMLLDLGSDSTMVSIMNQGVPRFNRNLVYGTKVISNSIQNHFGVGYDEAMKISTEQSLLNNTPEGNDYLSSDVSAALNQILNGVSRLVDYYTSRNKDGLERIILVGGGTNIIGISDYIENYFNIKTKILENTDVTKIEGNDYFLENRVFFANALGCIYSEINMLPGSIANKSKEQAANRLKIEVALLVLAVSAAVLYIPFAQNLKLSEERDLLIAEISEKETILPLVDEYNQVMTELSFANSIMGVSNSTTEVLAEILEKMEEVIPSQVNYLNLSNTEEGMIIACISSDKLEIVQVIKVLKAMELDGKKVFSKVYIPSVTNVEESNIETETGYLSFTVMCEYNKEGE